MAMEKGVRSYDKFPNPGEVEGIRTAVKRLHGQNPDQAEKIKKLIHSPNVKSHRLTGPEFTEGRYAIYYVNVTTGSDVPMHSHDEVVTVVFIHEGGGKVILDGESFPITKGDVVEIPPGTAHEFISEGGLTYIAVTSPDFGENSTIPDFRFL